MKKRNGFIALIMAFVLLTANLLIANASESIKIKVDDEFLVFDQMPVIENGRTLVPIRPIFEALGIEIEWNQKTSTVIGKLVLDNMNVSRVIEIKIGSNIAIVDGKSIPLDVPPKIIEGRTMVPARFIAESLDALVEWDNASRTVLIKSNGTRMVFIEEIFQKGTQFFIKAAMYNYYWSDNNLYTGEAVFIVNPIWFQ